MLSHDQQTALETLESEGNVFLTGAAGSGKSFLLKQFLKSRDEIEFPILASTGAAAILVGGRTFHSFFGLGILEGGTKPTIERALKNKRLIRRIKKTQAVIIDEVSMLSGQVLGTAELIARIARERDEPWGGLRVIAVGDFSQLPPVNPYSREKDWAFNDPVWARSNFKPAVLSEIHRTEDAGFLSILNQIREGEISEQVHDFLNHRTTAPPDDFNGTRLFARRNEVEKFNLIRLEALETKTISFETLYAGSSAKIEDFKKLAPVPEILRLKEGALVMIRQNDVEGRWVNGSQGTINSIHDNRLVITLLNGREVELEKTDFTLLDADGKAVVTATNFPVNLAWAVTIHKAQGTTLERMSVDLRSLWEPGQAYVALSRVRRPAHLYIEGWHPRSFIADPAVREFHRGLMAGA